MPLYEFHCEDCNKNFEVFRKMTEEKPNICIVCKSVKIYRIYDICGVTVDSKQPKTVGELADKNTEQMVKEGKLDKSHLSYDSNIKDKKKKFNKMRDISKMSAKQKERYILEGKM